VVLASGTAAIAIGLLLLGGKPLLSLLFGKSFLGAYAPLVLLMIVPFLGIFSFPLSPMLYALGRSDAPLKAKIIATAVFLGSIAPLCWTFGVMGAALALVLGNSANVATMMLQLRGERRRISKA
jgi:O-antigen/teichoic acid export membrane protein